MDLKITIEPFGKQPPVQLPDKDFLKHMTEQGIRKLISDHYNLLVKSGIKHMFPSDPQHLEAAKKHAADFFIQICGGYPYFNESRGAPMLRRRHRPFTITMRDRNVWLECYQQLLPKLDIPEDLIKSFWNYLDKFSLYMVNTDDQADKINPG
jgi:hemoglobin